ncbi:MAG: hypothetical protein ACK4TP_02515 [Hyphomicrobium sp.]|jgi:hypothetical protein
MRRVAACALVLAGTVARFAPAAATANWTYTCNAGDKKIELDVSLIFNQGTAGRISVTEADGTVRRSGKDSTDDDSVDFGADDVEQFWTTDDTFRIAFSAYRGEESEPARLVIDTACKALRCTGTYRYTRQGRNEMGAVVCDSDEKG